MKKRFGACVLLAVGVALGRIPAHLREHRDDPDQQGLAGLDSLAIRQAEDPTRVEHRSALHGGTPSDAVVLPSFGACWFPGAFGGIQRDRQGGTLELIREHGMATGQGPNDSSRQGEEFDRAAVNVQSFVGEHGRSGFSPADSSTSTSTTT